MRKEYYPQGCFPLSSELIELSPRKDWGSWKPKCGSSAKELVVYLISEHAPNPHNFLPIWGRENWRKGNKCQIQVGQPVDKHCQDTGFPCLPNKPLMRQLPGSAKAPCISSSPPSAWGPVSSLGRNSGTESAEAWVLRIKSCLTLGEEERQALGDLWTPV